MPFLADEKLSTTRRHLRRISNTRRSLTIKCILIRISSIHLCIRRWIRTSCSSNDSRSHWRPRKEPDLGYSGYVTSNIIHLHGILSTPRSLLFGIDADDDYKKTRAANDHLKKAYWSQTHALYRNHFTQADLFNIFGCSLGDSNCWWWRSMSVFCGPRRPRHTCRITRVRLARLSRNAAN